jgi:hypothetical protein
MLLRHRTPSLKQARGLLQAFSRTCSGDGQPDLPGGGHAVLPGGGQRDYSA